MKITPKTAWSMTIPLAGGLAGAAIGPAPVAAKGVETQATAKLSASAAKQNKAAAFTQASATPDLAKQPKLQSRSAKSNWSNLLAQASSDPTTSTPSTTSTPGSSASPTTTTPGASSDPTTTTTPGSKETSPKPSPSTEMTPSTPGSTTTPGSGSSTDPTITTPGSDSTTPGSKETTPKPDSKELTPSTPGTTTTPGSSTDPSMTPGTTTTPGSSTDPTTMPGSKETNPSPTDSTTPGSSTDPSTTPGTTPLTPSDPTNTTPGTKETNPTPGSSTDPNMTTPTPGSSTDPSTTPNPDSKETNPTPDSSTTPVTGDTPAANAPYVNYLYLGGDFGGGQVDPYNVGRTTGNIRVGSDRAANYGLFVGYRMGDIRLEGEFFSTGTSQLNRGEIQGDPASTATLSSGIGRSSAYMVNAYYDIPLGNTIKPYVGAGVGLMTSSFIGSSVVAPGPTDETYDASRSGLAYQLKAGFSYAMDSKTDVFLQYRYLTAPGSSGLNQIGDYSNQSFEGGLRIGL